MTPMTKLLALWVVLVAFAGAAFAQTGPGSAAAAAGSGATTAPGGVAAGSGATTAAATDPATPPAKPTSDARKACTDAMNADPQLAAAIVKIADEKAAKQRDDDTIAAHNDANYHVQKNERHVIYAYAAMWIVAAAFVMFLWRRQQALKAEIANLRRDLEAAADESAVSKGRA